MLILRILFGNKKFSEFHTSDKKVRQKVFVIHSWVWSSRSNRNMTAGILWQFNHFLISISSRTAMYKSAARWHLTPHISLPRHKSRLTEQRREGAPSYPDTLIYYIWYILYTQTDTDRNTDRQRVKHTDRETQTQKDTHTEIQKTDTDTDRDRDRERLIPYLISLTRLLSFV